jgi:hypothetical protein
MRDPHQRFELVSPAGAAYRQSSAGKASFPRVGRGAATVTRPALSVEYGENVLLTTRRHHPCTLGNTREDRMIRKLKSGEYRLYSRKADPRTGRRRNLGTFGSRAAAQKHEQAVQFFKRQH